MGSAVSVLQRATRALNRPGRLIHVEDATTDFLGTFVCFHDAAVVMRMSGFVTFMTTTTTQTICCYNGTEVFAHCSLG